MNVSVKKAPDFEIANQLFSDLLGTGKVWKDILTYFGSEALNLANFVQGGRREMTHARLTQGFLLKKSGTAKQGSNGSGSSFFTKWNKRWFALHSGKLYWFGSPGKHARGVISITSLTKIVECADKDYGFKIVTDDLPNGFPLAAMDAKSKRMWLRDLSRAIDDQKALGSSSSSSTSTSTTTANNNKDNNNKGNKGSEEEAGPQDIRAANAHRYIKSMDFVFTADSYIEC